MISIEKVKNEFMADIKDHMLGGISETGLVRHLGFRNTSGSSVHHFMLTTWPQNLAISGDMGCFVFSRWGTLDMFEFFRGEKLNNLTYITEKLVAYGKPQGYLKCRRYTYHYLWCICAIVWGIEKYDESFMQPLNQGKEPSMDMKDALRYALKA